MNEQEQFEAWVNSLNPGWLLDKTKNDGEYEFPRANAGWQAWQAAIATQQARIQALEKAARGVVEARGIGFMQVHKEDVPEFMHLMNRIDKLAALLEQEGGE